MPLRYDGSKLVFEATCIVDEALGLAEYCRDNAVTAADLSGCTYLHTSLLQVLAVVRPASIVPPADASLARWLMPVLQVEGRPS